MPRQVERWVYFYKIESDDIPPNEILNEIVAALGRIQRLRFSREGRYLDIGGPRKVLCAWPIFDRGPTRVVYARVDREDLPIIEEAGRLHPIGLPPAQGLAYSIHLMFFPPRIVAAESSFRGPHATSFPNYVLKKDPGNCKQFWFTPLVRPDIQSQLLQIGDLTEIVAGFSTASSVEQQIANEDVAATFEVARHLAEEGRIEVTIKPPQRSRQSLTTRAKDFLGAALGLVESSPRVVRKLRVAGRSRDSGEVIELDLLKQKLVTSRTMVLIDGTSRAVDDESAFSEIQRAQSGLRGLIIDAAGD